MALKMQTCLMKAKMSINPIVTSLSLGKPNLLSLKKQTIISITIATQTTERDEITKKRHKGFK